jgi:hypothetical protein
VSSAPPPELLCRGRAVGGCAVLFACGAVWPRCSNPQTHAACVIHGVQSKQILYNVTRKRRAPRLPGKARQAVEPLTAACVDTSHADVDGPLEYLLGM